MLHNWVATLIKKVQSQHFGSPCIAPITIMRACKLFHKVLYPYLGVAKVPYTYLQLATVLTTTPMQLREGQLHIRYYYTWKEKNSLYLRNTSNRSWLFHVTSITNTCRKREGYHCSNYNIHFATTKTCFCHRSGYIAIVFRHEQRRAAWLL